jgi:hypothetical protein
MNDYQNSNKDGLDEVIRQLSGARLVEAGKVADKGIRLCGNVSRSIATVTDLQESEAMELQLRAMRAWMDKDTAATEKYLKAAVSLHLDAGYDYGPPTIVKPSFEMYAEWLLENQRAKEALAQFETSLKYAPNRTLSVKGKEAAQKQLKQELVAAL